MCAEVRIAATGADEFIAFQRVVCGAKGRAGFSALPSTTLVCRGAPVALQRSRTLRADADERTTVGGRCIMMLAKQAKP